MADILKILKTKHCSSNGDLSLCQILCLYHYPFRNVKIWINFRKSSRFSLTSPLSQEREKSSRPVFTICGEPCICTFFFVFISTDHIYTSFSYLFQQALIAPVCVSISMGPICTFFLVFISTGHICTSFSYLFQQVLFVSYTYLFQWALFALLFRIYYQRIKFVPRFRIYFNKSNLYPIFVSTSTGPTCTCFRIYYRLITFDYMQYQSFLCTLISHFYLTVKFIPF